MVHPIKVRRVRHKEEILFKAMTTNPKRYRILLRMGLALLAVFSSVMVWMPLTMLGEDRQAGQDGQERKRLGRLRGRR